ncbi:hypothetical protein SEA_DRE3_63 [Gordonia phage Dre3]|uniref:Uncharacterized protein n=1 Tax=Gordonia phage Gibbous TaxID=2652405 RepID=A0A5J6T3X7_9CAUD|nr:hypothetical protein QLQ74_gp63 [Gordonia phage Gibbous]QFG05139.1 hypothetical protein SEA_GIBBOUS_63 [Gordonia phage Gibbous]QRI45992.1 hypothetical protein SEA_DRE3_63 [Gordonia phage Dre3]
MSDTVNRDIQVWVAGNLIVSGDIDLPFITELDEKGQIKVTMVEVLPTLADRLRMIAGMLDEEYQKGKE